MERCDLKLRLPSDRNRFIGTTTLLLAPDSEPDDFTASSIDRRCRLSSYLLAITADGSRTDLLTGCMSERGREGSVAGDPTSREPTELGGRTGEGANEELPCRQPRQLAPTVLDR